MKKYTVLSVNDNPQYLFYLPLTIWCWKKMGWNPITMFVGDAGKVINLLMNAGFNEISNLSQLERLPQYESAMIAQVSRLYASVTIGVEKEDYLMTGDIDMLPLSDYWKPDFNKITCWGHDLAGFGHYPICYIGMTKEKWDQVMMLNGTDYNSFIKRDLDNLPQARSANP